MAIFPGLNIPFRILGVVWNGLQTALGVLKESSDVFPPLKSAVGGLVACLNVVQVKYCY